MTNTQKVIIGLIVAVGLLALGFVGGKSGTLLGASVSSYEAGVKWFGNGFYAGLSQQFAVDNAGNLTANSLTLSNSSATSTASIGCLQLTATSSATTIKLVLSALGATSTFKGTAYWNYGTCP